MKTDYKFVEYGRFSSEFEYSRLSQLCIEKNGVQTGPFGSQLHKEDYVAEGTPIITVEHLGDNRIIHIDTPFVTDDDKKRLQKYQMKEGDIIFSRVGSVDRRALVRKGEDGWLFSGRCLCVRVDKTKIDPTYLSYFFGLESFKTYIRGIAVGATMPSINTKILSDVPVYYTKNLNQQKKIAKILSDLDDKIHLNNQINQTLGSIAQAIFKSWFIDFDPVRAKIAAKQEGNDPELAAMCAISGKSEVELEQMSEGDFAELQATAALFPDELVESELGEVPKGWELQSLYDTAEFVNGAAFKAKDFSSNTNEGLPIIKIAELKQGLSAQTKYTNLSFDQKYRVRSGDIFYSWSGSPETSLDVFKWFGGDGWLNQHIFKINTESKGKTYFVYYLLKYLKPTLIRLATNKQTTGLGHITVADMKSLQVIKPEEHLFLRYAKIVAPFYEKESLLKQEIINLAMLRDTLLPKLLSGEVSLGDVIDA
ncbi:restriction endonuclease subunit S [Acinetobacter johnsonii]|uniref:restriction endonuclease subunit S n=1 Tax=Acinetobacter johnsonii TaxID=40214 RepID=UPI002448F01D|nr:restriction endonuclease subunit S [Acinetobacter johnsonii]MDH1406645.1 restriction endonuclease subunit S [Acinetobacter johnsonii]